MNEATGLGDAEKIQLASQAVHQTGHKLLWIPWHRAPRWEQWKSFGFDVAIMQPNYAFVAAQHQGTVKRNRLAVNAELARNHGLGVEIETGDVVSSDVDRRAFFHYLADGAASRYGYQHAATAYYLANDNVERCAASKNPEVRRVYELLCDYVCGKEVPDQDPPIVWKAPHKLPLDLSTPICAEGSLAKPTAIQAIELLIEETGPNSIWRGSIQAEVRSASGKWTPAGWAIKSDQDANSGVFQAVAIPIGQTASAIRLSFVPAAGSAGKVSMACVDATSAPHVERHLAFRKPYRVEPPFGNPTYGDSGRLLTDGIVPKLGFVERKSVGWMNETVAIALDLGRPRAVSSVEASCKYSPDAAVNWPSSAMAILSGEPLDLAANEGLGALPPSLRWLAPSQPVVEQKRTDESWDGRLVFKPAKPAQARFATILFKASAWLMVSALRVFAEGRNVAPEGTYSFNPTPTVQPSEAVPYPDDGRKLNDGKIAERFLPRAVVGWQDRPSRSFVVDLGAEKAVREVEVWSLRGGQHAICSPERVSVKFSKDGVHWTGRTQVEKDPDPEDGRTCQAFAFKAALASPAKARFVRVVVKRRNGWAMLSEIAVR